MLVLPCMTIPRDTLALLEVVILLLRKVFEYFMVSKLKREVSLVIYECENYTIHRQLKL